MMKKGIRCLMAGLIVTSVMASSVTAFAVPQKQISAVYNGIKVNLNNRQLAMQDAVGKTVECFNYAGTVYAPLRAISQGLGLTVAYDSANSTVTLTGSITNSQQGGTPPTGNPPSGTHPTGDSSGGTPPTGNPPNGTPPTGNPPSGTPLTGNPPSGTPPTGNQSSQGSSGTQTKVVTKAITVSNQNITVVLNGEEVSLKDSNGNTVEPINYNGTIYLPVRAIAEALGLNVSYESASSTVKLMGSQAGVGNTGNGPGDNGNGADTAVSGTAIYILKGDSASKSSETITATKADESPVIVSDKGNLTLTDSIISKESGDTSSEETSNFSGLNAGILAKSGGTITISGGTVSTDSDGSNAIFATGDGTTINVSDTTINTTKNSSRGLDATYNGKIVAQNVNISTAGAHCGAIATDRGEGDITVTGGTMNTSGEGSPGIYSTGNIKVTGAALKATGSEAAVIEGKNSITLNDTVLSGAKKCGVMIYQSFSGDADVGKGSFTMTGGSLTAEVGPLFYSTNTNAEINLKNAKLSGASGILLSAAADRWGTTGSNGAEVTLTGDTQTLDGNVTCDSISAIAVVLKNNSILTGIINTDNKAKSMALTLDSTSKWVVKGTSYLTSFTDDDTSLANIEDNGNTIYYDADSSANSWLEGNTVILQDGGKLTPMN